MKWCVHFQCQPSKHSWPALTFPAPNSASWITSLQIKSPVVRMLVIQLYITIWNTAYALPYCKFWKNLGRMPSSLGTRPSHTEVRCQETMLVRSPHSLITPCFYHLLWWTHVNTGFYLAAFHNKAAKQICCVLLPQTLASSKLARINMITHNWIRYCSRVSYKTCPRNKAVGYRNYSKLAFQLS